VRRAERDAAVDPAGTPQRLQINPRHQSTQAVADQVDPSAAHRPPEEGAQFLSRVLDPQR
jgi:hypothetical protein